MIMRASFQASAPAVAVLSDKSQQRAAQWQKFLEEQRERALLVDASFDEEKAMLERTYDELERRLCSSP